MANNNNGNLWIFILACMGCVIISTIAYVAMKAATKSKFMAITVTIAVAVVLCVCVWQVFTQFENMVPKSERERLKAEKLRTLNSCTAVWTYFRFNWISVNKITIMYIVTMSN